MLAWLGRVLALAHAQLAGGGREGLLADERSDPGEASAGLLLNTTAVLLALCGPLCDRPADFVPKIDIGYLQASLRAAVGRQRGGG